MLCYKGPFLPLLKSCEDKRFKHSLCQILFSYLGQFLWGRPAKAMFKYLVPRIILDKKYYSRYEFFRGHYLKQLFLSSQVIVDKYLRANV